MSRRSNNIRGPTSALTDFLKESGITATTIAARVATRTQNNQADAQPAAGPSTAPAAQIQVVSSSSRRTRRESGYASDNLDEPEEHVEDAMDVGEEEETSSPAKKRKLSKAAEAKLKAKEKKKRGKKGSDDEDYEDEDAYTALSKSLWTNSAPKPPVGSFENCAVCKKQFTVTKYTMAANSGDGFLCHQCAKAGGKDPFKKPAAPKKRKVPVDKRTVTSFQERRFPSLVSLCIELITEHINDIEALGDLGTLNVEAIAKALSKNRSLTPENAHLFYNSTNKSLTLFDATNLNSPALETLAYHNSNLVSLRLDYCGQLTNQSIGVWSKCLPSLERIELLGPFLVHSASWQEFFKAHPKLETFLITQSPRFDLACMKALVTHCPGLKDLRLREVGLLRDSFLVEIKKLKKSLRLLDLSQPSESCSEAAMIKLLAAVGKNLTSLSLSKHDLLTDTFLTKGLQAHTDRLESLDLALLPELTDEGVARFFNGWHAIPLAALDMSRNESLGSLALEAILKHSAKGLMQLNINGWKDVGEDELRLLGRVGVELKKVDVSWCRAMDDFVMKAWLEANGRQGGLKRLEEVKVWGCNKISSSCPRKKGVVILGIESHSVL